MRKRIIEEASKALGCSIDNLDFDGKKVFSLVDEKEISLIDIANNTLVGGFNTISAKVNHIIQKFHHLHSWLELVETEVDKLTGKVDIIDYVAVVDCGTVVNPNLS